MLGPNASLPATNQGEINTHVALITGLSAGAHTIYARWWVQTGATVNTTGGYSLTVVELK